MFDAMSSSAAIMAAKSGGRRQSGSGPAGPGYSGAYSGIS